MLTDKGPLDGVMPEAATLNHSVWDKIYPQFKPSEFKHPEKMDASFLLLLWEARIEAGVPFRVISSVRNSSKSPHGEVPCASVDLQAYNSYERSRIVRAAYKTGFIRVGVYRGSDGFLAGKKRRDKGGIHVDASRTKPQDRLWTMKIRKTLAILALMMGLGAPIACQTGTATITVVDRSLLQVTVSPPTFTGELGDTITFTAIAVDTISGDTISGVLRWSSEDESAVSIDPQTGLATLLRAGTWQVFADLMEIVSMVILRQQDDGTFREVFNQNRQAIYASTGIFPDTLSLDVGQQAQLCAYLEDSFGDHYICSDCTWASADPTIASVSDGSNGLCPIWSPGFPFPLPAQQIPIPLDLLRSYGVRVG